MSKELTLQVLARDDPSVRLLISAAGQVKHSYAAATLTMRRRLFSFAAAVSFALFLATVLLWVRSYFRVDIVGDAVMPRAGANWYWRNRTAFSTDGGVLLLWRGVLVTTPRFFDTFVPRAGERYYQVRMPGQNMPRESFPGNHWFEFEWRPRQKPSGSYSGPQVLHLDTLRVRVPYWLPALVAAVPPAVWALRRRREARRVSTGRCHCCGYDLRATPDRCPECGAEPRRAAA